MDQRSRMTRTLGCLATAMTAAAALLAWADPTVSVPRAIRSPDEIRQSVHDLLAESVFFDPDMWHDVEILACPSTARPASFLTALPAEADYHWLVDDDARLAQTDLWRGQSGVADAPHTLRISVSRRAGGQPMSSAQWLCVRTLVTSLTAATGSDQLAHSVRLHPSWGSIYGIEDGTLLALEAATR